MNPLVPHPGVHEPERVAPCSATGLSRKETWPEMMDIHVLACFNLYTAQVDTFSISKRSVLEMNLILH
jgi:hypothetical protein